MDDALASRTVVEGLLIRLLVEASAYSHLRPTSNVLPVFSYAEVRHRPVTVMARSVTPDRGHLATDHSKGSDEQAAVGMKRRASARRAYRGTNTNKAQG